MKFDAARVTGMIEKLAAPPYQGQNGEATVADFVAEQFTEIGLAVERREVVGSRFPQRVAPWVGWLAYGALITASYLMLFSNHPLFMGVAIFLRLVGRLWLGAVLDNWIRIGRQKSPLETAPLVIASMPSESCPQIRVVFQAVLGGLQTDFFQSLRLDRRWIALTLHFCFLVAAVGQVGFRPEGIQLAPVDSALFAMIWIEIVCVLVWEYRGSRSAKASQTDRQGLSVLLELARCWPHTRSKQVEAVFVAAGGQRLDYAGSREVVRLLKSEWSSKPTFLVLFFAPGAGGEILAVEGPRSHSGSKKLIDDAAQSLWIPIRPPDPWAIAPFWPIASAWIGGSIAIIGSNLNASADAPVEPQVLHRAIQLSSEVVLRWAKNQQKPTDS
jgi:hypothetical protein